MTAQTTPLTYKRMQVPWVARWSDEAKNMPMFELRVPDGRPPQLEYPDGQGFRDQHGVLWIREGLKRGGVPQFGHVSSHRQRACMTSRRCQVCGRRISDRPIRWLMSAGQLWQGDTDGATLTISPPTCSDCLGVALTACPHLRTHDSIVVRVLDFRIWGIFGDAYMPDPERGRPHYQARKGIHLPYTSPLRSMVLAKQLVVEFTKFVVETT